MRLRARRREHWGSSCRTDSTAAARHCSGTRLCGTVQAHRSAGQAGAAGWEPWLIAGLLYLGSGVGLGAVVAIQRRPWTVARAELSWLAGAVVSSGVLAPVLLMIELGQGTASGASLLLVSEGVFTSIIAWAVLRENVDRRVFTGFVAVTAGTLVLLAGQTPASVTPFAAVYVLGACLLRSVDNTFTRNVALADPSQVAAIKGVVAGVSNVSQALAAGAHRPGRRPSPTPACSGSWGTAPVSRCSSSRC